LQATLVESYRDSAFFYGHKALALARKLNQKYYEGFILCDLAYNYLNIGDYTSFLKYLIDATKLSEDKYLSANIIKTPFIEPYLQKNAAINKKELNGWIKNSLGILYGLTGSNDKKLAELLAAKRLTENEVTDMYLLAGICSNIVDVYISKNQLDSALYYQKLTIEYENKTSRQTYYGVSLTTIGDIFSRQGKTDSAKAYLFRGLKMIKEHGEDLVGLASTYILLSNLYYDKNKSYS
jgi:tetratricopeptide (TPR) repeat protein